jgi:quercetin dioxygenase-like cupin family protein
MLFKATEPGRSSAGSVTFEPGARTAWHTHPLGQAILITAGCGWVQREGGPIEEVHPGDSVWFDAREKHWHGAASNTGMSQLVTEWLDSKVADWLEKVTDEQYRR